MYDDNTFKDLLGENYNSFKAELSYSLAVESIRNYTKAVGSIEDLFPSQLMALTKYYYEQDKLNRLYDAFNKKYGLINSRGNNIGFSNDSSYYLLCSLEILDENGNLARKADMFTKRTIRPKTKIKSVDNANDALIVSLSEKARVDLEYMQSLCGLDMDKMLKDLEGEI